MTVDLPFLDLTAPGFSTRSDAVRAARDQSWCARTPYGLAVLRHGAAGRILRDRRFRQGSYAWPVTQGLSGVFADFWSRSVISVEGDAHKAQRRLAQAALSDGFIRSLVPDFMAVAEGLLTGLHPKTEFDFVDAFSEPFAGRAITRLLDLPDAMAPGVARDAAALGLAMGVGSKRHEGVFNAACARLFDLAENMLAQATDGFVARLRDAAGGDVPGQVLKDLIVISIFGGVDTTRAQLAFLLRLLIDHPDQWAHLKADRSLIPNAIEEGIRQNPTTTWATREAVEDVDIDGVQISAGKTVHILVHATGTDPLVGADARFDITARRKIHFGFGGGAHHCLGQFVARTDMAQALHAILDHWDMVSWGGLPEWGADSGNTSPVTMPIRVTWRL